MRGINLFNAREFFDFHECFETVWLTEKGSIRTFLQALIQIGVGFYHLQNGNAVGLRNQLQKGLSKLDQLRKTQKHFIDVLGEDFLKQTEQILDARTAAGVLFPELPSGLKEIHT